MNQAKSAVYELAKEQGSINRKTVELTFHFGTTKAYSILKSLCKDGMLTQQKKGRQTEYYPSK